MNSDHGRRVPLSDLNLRTQRLFIPSAGGCFIVSAHLPVPVGQLGQENASGLTELDALYSAQATPSIIEFLQPNTQIPTGRRSDKLKRYAV